MGKKEQTLGYIEGEAGRGRRARADRELQNVTNFVETVESAFK